MRASIVVLLASRLAFADAPSDQAVGVYTEAATSGYTDSEPAETFELGADAGAYTTRHDIHVKQGDHEYVGDMRIVGRAVAAVRLGNGTTTPFAATSDNTLSLGLPGPPDEMNSIMFALHADHAATTQLASSRNLLAGAYDSIGFSMGTSAVDDTAWLGDKVGVAIDGTYIVQGDRARVAGHGVAHFWRWCRDGVGCLGGFAQEFEGFERPGEPKGPRLNVLGFWPLPVTNVVVGGVRIDARAGLLVGAIDVDGDRVDRNLPAYDVRASGAIGAIAFEVRAARRLSLSLASEFVRDDRIDVTARVGGDFSAHAFAAITRVWTDNFMTSSRGATGGADVELAHTFFDRWRVSATAAAAQTFHPSPFDAPTTPVLAASGTLALRYQWRDALGFLTRP